MTYELVRSVPYHVLFNSTDHLCIQQTLFYGSKKLKIQLGAYEKWRFD